MCDFELIELSSSFLIIKQLYHVCVMRSIVRFKYTIVSWL